MYRIIKVKTKSTDSAHKAHYQNINILNEIVKKKKTNRYALESGDIGDLTVCHIYELRFTRELSLF
jgi:hypothetical protein